MNPATFAIVDSGDHESPLASILRQTLHFARKYLPWIAGILAVSAAIGVALTALATPIYRSSGSIQIDPEDSKIVTVDRVVNSGDQRADRDFYQTQYELLKSRALASRVAAKLGASTILGNNDHDVSALPGATNAQPKGAVGAQTNSAIQPAASGGANAMAASVLMGGFHVAPEVGSRIVRLEFDNKDPALAARVVNAYMDEFIASNLERRYEASSYARNFLETRLNELRTRLETTERQLVSYATDQEIIAGGNGGSGDNAANGGGASGGSSALQRLQAALADATAARVQKQEAWRALSAGGQLDSSVLQTLRVTRAQVAADYQDKLAVFGPRYPAILQLRSRLAELDRQIGSEESGIRENKRAEVNAAVAAETALRGELRREELATLDLSRRSINYNILRRDLDTNKALYDGLLQRYREIGIAGGIGVNNIAVVDRARVPTSPRTPRPVRNMVLALSAGLLVAATLVFFLEYWQQAIRRPEDIQRKLKIPVIGIAPLVDSTAGILEMLEQPRSPLTEAYHSARTALQFASAQGMAKSLMVTSSVPSEGKSTTSTALAVLFARSGLKVVLVDCDLRKPSLHRVFGVRNLAGVTALLDGSADIATVVRHTETENLDFICSGARTQTPAELLSGDAFPRMLQALEAEYDLVVVDAPPVLGLADAPVMGTHVDWVLYAISANGASSVVVERGLQRLQAANAEVVGAVLTRFDVRREDYGGYGYDYMYGYYAYTYGSDAQDDDEDNKSADERAASRRRPSTDV